MEDVDSGNQAEGKPSDEQWGAPDASAPCSIEMPARKPTEEALRESEQILRQLAEQIAEVFWVRDINLQRSVYVSPAYERVWGRTRESLYRDPMSFADSMHPEDRPRFIEAFEAQLQSHIPLDINYRIIRPDGSTRWIWDRSFPVRDASGEIYRFVGIAEDITERRRVEKRLRRSETYLEESERLSSIGTWAVAIPSLEIVFWSRQHYRIFGFDAAAGPPAIETVFARVHPEDKAVRERLRRALLEPKDFEENYRIVLPDGSIRYIRSLGHPVLNDAGELVECIGMAVDVTDRQLADDALQSSLVQLRALAARVESVREEERTRLAREIHDELGQVLTGIKLDLRSIVDHPHNTEQRNERLQAILHGIDGAIQSVRKIATDLRPGILDDLGVVAAVEWAAKEFAARMGIKCSLDLPREELDIESEIATALFRILQESLTNIARHSAATEFTIRLAEVEGLLWLEIRDNGRGFEKPQITSGGSLGILGMEERALLLGGRFTIDTLPGKGVTVSAWIPRRHSTGGAK